MKEQIFLSEKRIKVTNARLMIKDETYSIAGIISVKSGFVPGVKGEKTYTFRDKLKIIFYSFVFLGGFSQICLLFSGFISNFVSLISLSLMTLVIYVTATAKDDEDGAPAYSISLRTASGELRVLENQDLDFVQRVLKAINSAIVARG